MSLVRSRSSAAAPVSFTQVILVVAILGILGTILYPVCTQAREKNRESACMSNMRQVGSAMLLYIQDFDQRMPLRASDVSNFAEKNAPANWVAGIYPYMKDYSILRCPNAVPAVEDNRLPNAAPSATPHGVQRFQRAGKRCGDATARQRDSQPGPRHFSRRRAHPRDRALLRPRTGDNGKTYTSWHGIDGVSHVERYNNNHRGGGTLLFCDGHAAWRKCESLRTGDFGLIPDQAYSLTNDNKADNGQKYHAAF